MSFKGAIIEWVEHPRTKRRSPLRLDKSFGPGPAAEDPSHAA